MGEADRSDLRDHRRPILGDLRSAGRQVCYLPACDWRGPEVKRRPRPRLLLGSDKLRQMRSKSSLPPVQPNARPYSRRRRDSGANSALPLRATREGGARFLECSIKGCENTSRYAATGWCQTHYHRYWRTGTTSLVPRPLNTDVLYKGAHARVRIAFGKAADNACVVCGGAADEWAYDGTDETARTQYIDGRWPVTYSAWPEFYMPLCYPCHRAKDRGAWAKRRTHCINGHELAVVGVYERPSRPGTRECQECRRAVGRRRYQQRKARAVIGRRVVPGHNESEEQL